MRAPRWGLLGASTGAWAAVLLLHRLGAVLPPPPSRGAALSRWFAELGPAGSLLAVLRGAGLAVALWLALAATVQLLAGLPWGRPLRPLAACISPRCVAHLARGVAGASIAASVLSPLAGPSTASAAVPIEQDDPDALATMERLDGPAADPGDPQGPTTTESPPVPPTTVAPTTTASTDTTLPVAPPAVPAPVAEAAPDPSTPVTPPIADSGTGADPSPAVPLMPPVAPTAEVVAEPPVPAEDLVLVEPGDSLWSLAEEALIDDDRAHDDRAVARYWHEVVELNRPTLLDAGNPDLILPGQMVRLPPR